MKRKRNLLTKTSLSIDLCKDVIKKAAKGKRKRYYVRNILTHIDTYAIRLQKMILEETYVPTPYKYKTVIELGKERNLAKPKFWPDQCVHHALYEVAKDIFNNHIDPHAISSISNRGIDMGVKLLKRWMLTNDVHKLAQVKYCVKFDIRKCYESVTPEVVMKCIKRVIKDKKYIRILERILSLHPSLPLGNFLSSWLLNLLLRDVDNLARGYRDTKGKRVCTHYIRYMDDIAIFAHSKRKLWRLFFEIKNVLNSLGLEVKRKSFAFFPTSKRAVDMLGYKFSHTGVGWRKKNLKKFKRECIRFHLGKRFSPKRAMGLLSRLASLKRFSSRKVWEFSIKHINIETLKAIAYPGYKKKVLKKRADKLRRKQLRMQKLEQSKLNRMNRIALSKMKRTSKSQYASTVNSKLYLIDRRQIQNIHMYQYGLETRKDHYERNI